MRSTAGIGVLAIAVLFLAAQSATADRISAWDEDDAKGPLDVRLATNTHGPSRSEGDRLRFTVSTYEAWSTSVLGRRLGDKHMISFWISTNGPDCCAERTINIVRVNKELRAVVCCFGKGAKRRHVPAWRPDDHSVRVAIRPVLLGKGLTKIHWFADVIAEYSRKNCGGSGGDGGGPPPVACGVDRAPNGGRMRHRL